ADGGDRGGGRRRPRLPARAAPARARPAAARARILRRLAEADRGHVPRDVERRALRRDHDEPCGLDRPDGRARREGGRDLDREHRPARHLGERDLQPERGHDLPHRTGLLGRPARAAALGLTQHRAAARRRQAGSRAVRDHRRVARARREGARRGSTQGHAPLPRRRAAPPGLARRGPVSAGHVVGKDRHLHAPPVPRRLGLRPAAERSVALRHAAGRDRRREERLGAADRYEAPARSASPARRRLHRPLRGGADARARTRHEGLQPRHPRARRPLHALHLHPVVRIAWDVSPLSHPRTGVGNYLRGSLAGFVEAAAGAHEVVAFAPTSPPGLKTIPRALEGIDVDLRLRLLPFAHLWRQAWSRLGRPPVERFLGPIDVLHFSDWMYPPQWGGLRSTMVHDLVPLRFPEWVQPRTRRMHRAKYANAARTCDVIFTNSEFTKRDVLELLRFPAERVRVAPPGIDARFRPGGERADLGRPYALTVATLEPRKNLGTLIDAHRMLGSELALAVVGAEGW